MDRVLSTLVLALSMTSCALLGSERLDPADVDPSHYSVEFENERVRVLRARYGAGEESVMHFHPEHVGIMLTSQHVSFETSDGTMLERTFEAGDYVYAPAGEHLPRNLGEPFEVLVLELKDSSSGSSEKAGPDPAEVDSSRYTVEFENDRVRILRIIYRPGEESVMHYHPDHFAVFFSDHHAQFRAPDGSVQEIQMKAGDHVWAPAGQHQPKNLSDEPLIVLAVEVK